MKGAILFILLILNLFSMSCTSKNSNKLKRNEMQNFLFEIQKIDQQVKELTSTGVLFKYEFFISVYENPKEYVEYVYELLKKNYVSEQQKIIAVLSMQKLPYFVYIEFNNKVFELFENSFIIEKIFKWSAFPPYEWNINFAINYESTIVQEFLRKVVKSKLVSLKLKEYLQNEIMTGNAKEQVYFLKDIGQIK